jgi:hypothetical protein
MMNLGQRSRNQTEIRENEARLCEKQGWSMAPALQNPEHQNG